MLGWPLREKSRSTNGGLKLVISHATTKTHTHKDPNQHAGVRAFEPILTMSPQNDATSDTGSFAHAVLFKVKLNTRMFGGRWLTPMHRCAHRLWPKSGESEWAMESVFPAQSNMLRPLHRKVTYSHLYRHPSPSSSAIPLWNAGFRCLSPVSRCQSAAFHYTPALCSGRAKKGICQWERGA